MRRRTGLFLASWLLISVPGFAAHQAVLTWTPSADSTATMTYSILKGTSSGGESPTPIATGVAVGCTSTTTCTYTDTNVVASGAYFYQVVAVQGSGQSAPSNEASCTIPLAAATGLVVVGH